MKVSVHNSPIVIEGGGENEQLSYKTIREFMMCRKKSVTISEETVTFFLKKVKKNDISADYNQEEYVNDGKVKVAVQQSISSYESIRSAISYVYRMYRVPIPKLMQDNLLRMILAGKRRAGIKKKGLDYQSLKAKIPFRKKHMNCLQKHYFLVRKRSIFLVMCFSC